MFQFTRHATSCNNANAGSYFGKDFEPGLTNQGIKDTQKWLTKGDNKRFFNSNVVYVSCLYRTWCTAILLYSKNQNTLTLKVSPFLKEDLSFGGQQFGNFPRPIQEILPTFIAFLNYLTKRAIRLPKQIVLVFPPHNVYDKEYRYTIKREGNVYKVSYPQCIDVDPLVGDSKKSNGFHKGGDLTKFMAWYHKHAIHSEKVVHAVTHSKVMKKYVAHKRYKVTGDVSVIKRTNCSIVQVDSGRVSILPGYAPHIRYFTRGKNRFCGTVTKRGIIKFCNHNKTKKKKRI